MTRFLLYLIDQFKKLLELTKLSLTSAEFYKKLYLEFSGFGLYFLFTLSFLGSTLTSLILLMQISPIFTYFDNRIVTNRLTANIDAIISNWDPLTYNGLTIDVTSPEPIFLKGIENKVLIAIDPSDQLKGSIKKEIPIVFGKSKLQLNFIKTQQDSFFKVQNDFEYPKIFGDSKRIIDSNELVKSVKAIEPIFNSVYIFVFFPILAITIFVLTLLEKSLMVLVVYFALKTFVDPNAKMKASIRMVAFSAGAAAFLFPLTLVSEAIGSISNIAQLWAAFLIIHTITTLKLYSKN